MNPMVQPQGFTPTVAQNWIGADTSVKTKGSSAFRATGHRPRELG